MVDKNIKVGDVYIRDYDAELYSVKNLSKVNLLAIDSSVKVLMSSITGKPTEVNCIYINNILRGWSNDDLLWVHTTEEELSKIELPQNTDIDIDTKEHGLNIIMFSDNKCYIKTKKKYELSKQKYELLSGCTLDRARRLLCIGYWKKIN